MEDTGIKELAIRIDTIAQRLVPFEYGDAGADVDMVLDCLKENPIGVMEYLVELIETMV